MRQTPGTEENTARKGGHHRQEPFAFKTRTTAHIPTQEAATIEKGIELSEEEATLTTENGKTSSRLAQVPEENSMKDLHEHTAGGTGIMGTMNRRMKNQIPAYLCC